MTKEQTVEVRNRVDELTGVKQTQTYSSKSETLHIRIATYTDSTREMFKDGIRRAEALREELIEKLSKEFPQYTISKNNKRYQGFINDICITVK